MRCIITAGPTFEPLDRVRRLTNHSTGSLGTGLANHFAMLGFETVLLRGSLSTAEPPVAAVRMVSFGTVEELGARLADESDPGPVAVFHAAAVGDYRFGEVIQEQADGTRNVVVGGKIATRGGRLFAELLPTRKLLPGLRDLFPLGRIVGWKYEVDGNRDSVLDRCRHQLQEARTDLSIANGPAYGAGFGWVTATEHRILPDAPALYEALATLAR